MGFTEQLTLLVAIIIVLGVILTVVTMWSKRSGSASGGGGGGGLFGLGGGGGDSIDLENQIDLDEVVEEYPRPGDRKKGPRFELKGPQAEIAAKVLKRWLKQDRDGSEDG